MKFLTFIICLVTLAGCSTPNQKAEATPAAYERVHCGMSRQEVYALLGPPRAVKSVGDPGHCETATWSIPHKSHGRGHWTITFTNDQVTGIATSSAIVWFGE